MKRVVILLICMAVLFAGRPWELPAKAAVVEVKHNLARREIMTMANNFRHSGLSQTAGATRYAMRPRLYPPYEAGALNSADMKDALNVLKMMRFLAGVPYESVYFTPELNKFAQHGAVLLAASDQLSHTPTKPDDMRNDFFTLAYYGCSQANIFAGADNISAAIVGFIVDGGSNNIEAAGHRRWILAPGAGNFGIGYAAGGGTYGGSRVNLHVFRANRSIEASSYVAWPNSGDFPIQYFVGSEDIDSAPAHPWSINLGALYAPPVREKIIITMRRLRDGKKWLFDHTTSNLSGRESSSMHLSVDDNLYGMGKAILFRPDLPSLGIIKDGDIFEITVSGIYTVKKVPAEISYRTHFFDMSKSIG